MISVDLTSRPLMPIASASCSSHASRMLSIVCLIPEIEDLVAIVGQDDIDQVLADVVDVALDGSEHHCCPWPSRRLSFP